MVAGTVLSVRKAGFFQKDLCRLNRSKHRLHYSSGLGIAAFDAREMYGRTYGRMYGIMYGRIPGRNTPFRCFENERICRGILFGKPGLKSRPKNVVVTQRL